jgi:acyl-CoA reductase-like NAD-dependent aldehyde dehydrogenase
MSAPASEAKVDLGMIGTLTVIEPATSGVLTEIPRAGVDEVDAAVERARAAFRRGACLHPVIAPSGCARRPAAEQADQR